MIKLYEHQIKAVNAGCSILKSKKLLYLAGEPRTGKTFTSLVIAQKLDYNKILFVTKKKAISSIKKDIATLAPSYLSTVINYESVHKIENHSSFDLIICDEAHNMGALPKPSKRAATIKKMFYGKDMILMSGTPSPETQSQLFHQFYVSPHSPWSDYRNFYYWAKTYVNIFQRKINSQMINDYTRAKGDLIDKDIQPFFYKMSQIDAGFEALVQEKFLYVPMTIEQQSYYKQMDKDYCVANLNVTATNAADRINKLSQISSGSIINDDSETKIISIAKAHFIQQKFFNNKIAIFYKYKAELDVLTKFFDSTNSPEEFNQSYNKVFVGQFQSIREGVDLRTADCIIMYNIDFSATSYWQSIARLQNKERTKEAIIYWIFSQGGIEDYVYKAVSNKKNFTSRYYNQACKKKSNTQKKKYSQQQFNPLNLLGIS